jgi:uncharacterized protein YjbI with pentapeptide repeats
MDTMQVERRKVGPEELEQLLKEGPEVRDLDLSEQCFASMDVTGRFFVDCDLRAADWCKPDGKGGTVAATLTQATLRNCLIGNQDEESWWACVVGSELQVFFENVPSDLVPPSLEVPGTLFYLRADGAKLPKSLWYRAHFGGSPEDWGPSFDGTDFSGATFLECNLRDVDWSTANLHGASILKPVSVFGLRVRSEDAQSIAENIELAPPQADAVYKHMLEHFGHLYALNQLGIVVVDPEE